MSELQHTYLTGPWHYCGVCYEKCKIDEMKWQRGCLKCPICVDTLLLGQREIQIAQVLDDGKEELAPVDKIREPDTNTETEDFSF